MCRSDQRSFEGEKGMSYWNRKKYSPPYEWVVLNLPFSVVVKYREIGISFFDYTVRGKKT